MMRSLQRILCSDKSANSHSWISILSCCLLTWLCCAGAAVAAEKEGEKGNVEFFEKRIRPVLIKHCYECHSEQSEELGGNLLLDSQQGMQAGGESGPAVVPEDLSGSLLIDAIEYKSFEMPPDAKLPDNVIADFKQWIKMGAPDPRIAKAAVPVKVEPEASGSEKLWSLEPLSAPQLPQVNRADWPQSALDHFVLAALEQEGLKPVADAEPLALLRRLSFDLIGLPPSVEQMDRVAANPSAETFESIIDQLLASPQFGQRWARHWLDVARFAESAGSSRDVLMPYAWKYRDYVIDAYNNDLPYPQFITEQVAGDLLPAASPEERQRLQVATGLLAIGQKSLNGGNVELDIVDDQIDVIGKAVLGLTISCARCHDHKFDPIPTRDYYSLAGIFLSTETRYGGGTNRPNNDLDKAQLYLTLGQQESLQRLQQLSKQLNSLNKEKQQAEKQIKTLTNKLPKDWKKQKEQLTAAKTARSDSTETADKKGQSLLDQINRLESVQSELAQIEGEIQELTKKRKQVPPLDFAVGLQESNQRDDTRIRVRGEKNQQGQPAPRGFLQCITPNSEEYLAEKGLDPIDSSHSGRVQLAAWLTDANNPLTARVAVNRIWLHLFGRGIVPTVDNFGHSGMKPSHPELLDYLAHQYIENGWSTKQLVREIVMSRSYRLATNFDEQNYTADPENKYYWRMSRRRLDAEALRDAMLSASGELKLQAPPYGSLVAKIGEGEVGRNLNTKPLNEAFPYRSVYLPIIRGILPEALLLFDFPEPSNPQSVRDTTTVPAQSLYFMNSPEVIAQAEATARRVMATHPDRQQRVRYVYQLALARLPTDAEQARVDAYLSESLSAEQAQPKEVEAAWTAICQSLFASAEFRYLP